MAFSSVSDLHHAIRATEPHDFVSHPLFEPVPYAFSGDLRAWISWKRRLARHLEVDPYEMVLTGSGAIGYSLNPTKGYKPFDDVSDIDVAVISAHHFEVAWRYLRHSRPSWLSLPQPTRNALASHRKNYVFAGAIATDMILSLLPFGKSWQGGLDEMTDVEPTVGREVKLRIYRDYDALRYYHAHNIANLRQDLMSGLDQETAISTEEEVRDSA
jgi:hypothetical protein